MHLKKVYQSTIYVKSYFYLTNNELLTLKILDTSKKNAYFCIYNGYSMIDDLLLLTIKKYLEAIFYPFEVENIN